MRHLATAVALILALASCGGDDGGPTLLGSTDPLFDPAHVVEVSITMSPADWDDLRQQARSLADIFGSGCMTGPFVSPFTWFSATVTIDGHTLPNVAVRKKGFLGSLDEIKPSLKLKFDEFVPGREFFGLDRITLNNSKQDPSYVRQALAYAAFTRAGIPAPRCNFAHVTVNGNDLGLFVHVESLDKAFLRRHFPSDAGNFYEGTLSDFRTTWINTFDRKTNEADLDRSDLDGVASALAAPDAQVESALDQVIDVDEFITFWAAEVLVNHWDGYANNNNNFYIYADPADGRFTFIPWGTDGVMTPGINFGVPGQPVSVFAQGGLARRLYLLPATRQRYLDALNGLLNTAWNETAIVAEIARMEALITPIADPTGTNGLAAKIDEVRTFVQGRRAAIVNELAGGPPPWTAPLRDPICFDVVGDVSGTFSTTFDTLNAVNPFASGTGTFAATINGVPRSVTQVGSKAGTNPDPNAPNTIMTQVVALLSDGTVDVLALVVDASSYGPGNTVPLDWGAGFGALFNYNPSTLQTTLVGFILGGTVHFNQASTTPGAPVTGSFTGQILKF